MLRKQEGAMEARVLKHYLLLHDATAEGEDGADRCAANSLHQGTVTASPLSRASGRGPVA